MIPDLFTRIPSRMFLCTAVAAALGLVVVSSHTVFRVQAQTAPQAGTADSGTTVHVDVTPASAWAWRGDTWWFRIAAVEPRSGGI